MTTPSRRLFVLLSALLLCGCGGVMDSVATHQVDLRVSRHGHAVSHRTVAVAMRTYENVPFTKSQHVATTAAGTAHAEFKTMWGSAFLIIPPVGSVPSRPPKPVYSVTVGGKQVLVSPATPGVTYRWEHGSWHTEASVNLP